LIGLAFLFADDAISLAQETQPSDTSTVARLAAQSFVITPIHQYIWIMQKGGVAYVCSINTSMPLPGDSEKFAREFGAQKCSRMRYSD
jgi:hypothetical protein